MPYLSPDIVWCKTCQTDIIFPDNLTAHLDVLTFLGMYRLYFCSLACKTLFLLQHPYIRLTGEDHAAFSIKQD